MVQTQVTDQEVAFGGRLLPKYEDIPDEFKILAGCKRNKWVQLTEEWFYNGLKSCRWHPKPGIDTEKALRHIKVIMVSFGPKHEHKIAGVAYLLSQFFEDVEYEVND